MRRVFLGIYDAIIRGAVHHALGGWQRFNDHERISF